MPDRDGPDCPHGYPSWRRTRSGEFVCPICRRQQRAARMPGPPRRPRQAAFSLGDLIEARERERDDEPADEPPAARVIPISRGRRHRDGPTRGL